VFRAKTPEGFIRALKVQFSNLVTDPDAIDNEFGEVGRLFLKKKILSQF
jgi:hypothetical protein